MTGKGVDSLTNVFSSAWVVKGCVLMETSLRWIGGNGWSTSSPYSLQPPEPGLRTPALSLGRRQPPPVQLFIQQQEPHDTVPRADGIPWFPECMGTGGLVIFVTGQGSCSEESWISLWLGLFSQNTKTLKYLLSACVSSVQPVGLCHLKWQEPHFHGWLLTSLTIGSHISGLRWDLSLLFYSWVLTFPLEDLSAWSSFLHVRTPRFVDFCVFPSLDGNIESCDGLLEVKYPRSLVFLAASF